MNELAQHIEALLLENDCVIVPRLGGFVAHYASAVHIEEDNRFLPPTRLVGFNPLLNLNDGLLVQSYMTVYGTTFPDAQRRMEIQVDALMAQLHEDGRADLPNVGELRYSIKGVYDFLPYDNKLTSPALYGLDSFDMQPIVRQIAVQDEEDTQCTIISMPEQPRIELVVEEYVAEEQPVRQVTGTSWMRKSVAAVAAVAALLLLLVLPSAPVQNTEVQYGNYARLLPADLFDRWESRSLAFTSVVMTSPDRTPKSAKSNATRTSQKQQQAIEKKITVKEVKVSPVAMAPKTVVPAVSSQPTAKPSAVETKAVSKRYHIIVASVGTERDARSMAEALQNNGFKEAKALIGDGKMRVCIRSFENEAAAYRALADVRQQKQYESAWVLKK